MEGGSSAEGGEWRLHVHGWRKLGHQAHGVSGGHDKWSVSRLQTAGLTVLQKLTVPSVGRAKCRRDGQSDSCSLLLKYDNTLAQCSIILALYRFLRVELPLLNI